MFQKGCTTVEWTWWRHRNENNKDCPPQTFLANSVSAPKLRETTLAPDSQDNNETLIIKHP